MVQKNNTMIEKASTLNISNTGVIDIVSSESSSESRSLSSSSSSDSLDSNTDDKILEESEHQESDSEFATVTNNRVKGLNKVRSGLLNSF